MHPTRFNCDALPRLRSNGSDAERHKAGLATLQCFATAFNAGDESAMRKLSAAWVEYFWESTAMRALAPKLHSEQAAGARYLETPLSVIVDSGGQVTGTLGRTSPSGRHSEVYFRLGVETDRLRVVAINDAEEQRLNDQCTEAVSAALSSVESVQKWEASLPAGISPGGFAEPLKDGHLEMSLGASLPERMETIYWATVDFGYLRLSQDSAAACFASRRAQCP